MLLAAFAVVLGVCAVLGGLAVWKVYQQRQVCLATAMAILGDSATCSDNGVTYAPGGVLVQTCQLQACLDSHDQL